IGREVAGRGRVIAPLGWRLGVGAHTLGRWATIRALSLCSRSAIRAPACPFRGIFVNANPAAVPTAASESSSPASGSRALNRAPEVLQALADVGYEMPTPTQAATIPPLLGGADLLGQAQTGTGKTAAFALPVLSKIDLGRAAPQA